MGEPSGLTMHITKTGWTGKCLPTTAGNEAVHKEIAATQVMHWSKEQIQAAEQNGYFDSLHQRCQVKTYYRLLDELMEEDEE